MLAGKGDEGAKKRWWLTWLFPTVGLVSLIWFLVRVVPKPNRAAYPCQRVAGSLAGGFVVWIAGLVGSVFAYRRGKQLFLHSRLGRAVLCFAMAAVAVIIAIERMPERLIWADPGVPANAPIGVGRGVNPGRVVWVHDPDVSSWAFPGAEAYGGQPGTWDGEQDMGTYGYWYERTNQTLMDQMVSDAILGVAGESSEAGAWDAIFRNFNVGRGKGAVGYQAGEKFMIKINLTTSNRVNTNIDGSGNQTSMKGYVNTSPQIILSVLRQLVNVVGVNQSDITVGDTSAYFPNHYWNLIHPEFPNVRYLDCAGLWGRAQAQSSQGTGSEQPIDWSTSAANGYEQDYLPSSYAQAEYLINLPVLKGHYCGITVCGKNHFGSLIRLPDPCYAGQEDGNYYRLHHGIPGAAGWYSPGMGFWRPMVDMMGHSHLGEKTVLYLVDGVYGGYKWEGRPYRWQMAPFNGGWPCSVFASQDPVAIDSVAYDFLLTEWPVVVAASFLAGGAEDYLHEAALAHDPDSGTIYDPDGLGQLSESLGVHEHWNNSIDKQYSRNLGIGSGIELYVPGAGAIPVIKGDLTGDGTVNRDDLVAFSMDWLDRILPDEDLVARWMLDESAGETAEEIVSGYTGDVVGGADWRPSEGHFDGAIYLSGEYIKATGYKGITGSSPRTCSAWIRTQYDVGDLISWGTAGGGNKWQLSVYNGFLRVSVAGGWVIGSTYIADNQWHHVAAASDGTTTDNVKLYVDGNLDTPSEFQSRAINTAVGNDVSIGAHFGNNPPSYYYGYVDDVRIYDRVMVYGSGSGHRQMPRGTAVVDADLSDWAGGDVEWVDLDVLYYGDPDARDVSQAKFSVRWDEPSSSVFVAVVVTDSDDYRTDNFGPLWTGWDAGDRIEILSCGDGESATGWSTDHDVAQEYVVGVATTGGDWAAWGTGHDLNQTPDPCLHYAARMDGNQYIYEAQVKQYDNYGGFTLDPTVVSDLSVGEVLRFEIIANTRHSAGFGMKAVDDNAGKYDDSGKIIQFELVETISHGSELPADLDGDLDVDGGDFAIMAGNWMATTGGITGLVEEGAQLMELYSGGPFLEGPCWDPGTGKLYFCAYTSPQTVVRLDGPGIVTEWLSSSNFVNGTFIANDGRMITAEVNAHKVMSYRIGASGPEDPQELVYDPTLRQPNDLCQTTRGDIYFSDPDWGVPANSGVYRRDLAGVVTKVISDMGAPNGLVASNEGTALYVADSTARHLRKYPIYPDGSVGSGQVFYDPGIAHADLPDGLTIDELGNVYMAGLGGVWAISPAGTLVEMIEVPETASNVTFGGPDNKTLFITCQGKVYGLRMQVAGGR